MVETALKRFDRHKEASILQQPMQTRSADPYDLEDFVVLPGQHVDEPASIALPARLIRRMA
jgi:hypothetical protein